MASYLAKYIDDDLWQRVKARAEKEGHPLRWIFTQLWTYYAINGLPRDQYGNVYDRATDTYK